MKVVSWILFILCLPFAGYVVALPLAYYFSPLDPYRGEILEAWLGLTLFGFLPALSLSIVVWLQRHSVPIRILALWAIPAVIILISAAVQLNFAMRS